MWVCVFHGTFEANSVLSPSFFLVSANYISRGHYVIVTREYEIIIKPRYRTS